MPSSTSDHSHTLTYPALGSTTWNSTMVTLFQNISDYLDAIGTTSLTLIDDSNGNEMLAFSVTGSAVNYFSIANAATGNGPILSSLGDDSNIPMSLKSKGTGNILLLDGSSNEMLVLDGAVSSAVNYITISPSATGNDLLITATGSDTNIDLSLVPKGSGAVVLDGLRWPNVDGSADQVLKTDGSGNLGWVANSPNALENVVEDTTPQLGGNLDVNGNSIVSTAGGNIAITPNTSGAIVLDGLLWPVADGSADQVLKTNGAGVLSWTANVGSGLANVVDDTTPQLGGALDVNGYGIVSTAGGNINITPNTSGAVVIDGLSWPTADGTADYVLKTNGAGVLSWTANTGSGLANIVDDTTPQLGGHLDPNGFGIAANGTAELLTFTETTSAINYIDIGNAATGAYPVISAAGDDSAVGLNIKTKGNSDINFKDSTGANSVYITTNSGYVNQLHLVGAGTGDAVKVLAKGSDTNVGINIIPKGSGRILLDNNYWPNADGTNGQVLQTDGAGTLSWTANTGGLSNVVEDTTPQLGGSLDVNGQSIVSTAGGNIAITPDTTGAIILDGLSWPTADGTADYVLKTNGAGVLSWTANTGSGLANIVDDTTPQLGGNLDANAFSVLFDSNTGVRDAAGNEQILFIQTTSAVNYATLTNGATGNGPTLTAAGSETNVDFTINAKGTGNINLGNYTLNADATVGAGQDNYVLTYDNASGTWGPEAAAGGGSMPTKELIYTPGAFESNETNPASLEFLNGTTVDLMVRAFDDTTTEYVNGKILVPGDIDTSGTVTFRAYVMAKTAAASKNIELTFDHKAINDGEDFDAAYTSEVSGDIAINATQDNVTEATWTETVTNLGWAANDYVMFRLSRTPPSANNLTGDMYLMLFVIEVPRA